MRRSSPSAARCGRIRRKRERRWRRILRKAAPIYRPSSPAPTVCNSPPIIFAQRIMSRMCCLIRCGAAFLPMVTRSAPPMCAILSTRAIGRCWRSRRISSPTCRRRSRCQTCCNAPRRAARRISSGSATNICRSHSAADTAIPAVPGTNFRLTSKSPMAQKTSIIKATGATFSRTGSRWRSPIPLAAKA